MKFLNIPNLLFFTTSYFYQIKHIINSLHNYFHHFISFIYLQILQSSTFNRFSENRKEENVLFLSSSWPGPTETGSPLSSLFLSQAQETCGPPARWDLPQQTLLALLHLLVPSIAPVVDDVKHDDDASGSRLL
jgi:hypothetical protein